MPYSNLSESDFRGSMWNMKVLSKFIVMYQKITKRKEFYNEYKDRFFTFSKALVNYMSYRNICKSFGI